VSLIGSDKKARAICIGTVRKKNTLKKKRKRMQKKRISQAQLVLMDRRSSCKEKKLQINLTTLRK
jgi:hypothetical protein